MNGSDYTGITMSPLTFSAGSSDDDMQCVNVSIIDDNDALEGDETFTVTLATRDSDVMIGNNQTVITISDNEGIIIIRGDLFYILLFLQL